MFMDSLRPEVLAYLALVALLALGWLVYLLQRGFRRRALRHTRLKTRGAGDYAQRHEPGAGLVQAPAISGANAAVHLTAHSALSAAVNNSAPKPAGDMAKSAANWRRKIFGARQADRRVSGQTPSPTAEAQPAAVSHAAPGAASNAAPATDFANHLQRASAERTLEVDVLKLRQEVAELRAELANVASGLQQLKTVRPVAPAYTEAVALARQGLSIGEIAAQCGISLGEAELVFSMAQSERQARRI